MANTASARKRIRSNERRRVRNLMVRSELKTLVKKAVVSTVKTPQNAEALAAALKALDQAAVKGVIHKNQAARRKSRLARRFNIANGIGKHITVS